MKYWEYSALKIAEMRKFTLLHMLLEKDDYLELDRKLLNLQILGYIVKSDNKIELTRKGSIRMHFLEKTLVLKGINKQLIPIFNEFVDTIEVDEVYLP